MKHCQEQNPPLTSTGQRGNNLASTSASKAVCKLSVPNKTLVLYHKWEETIETSYSADRAK